MGIELANENGTLGQFASNAGYSDLIEIAQSIPALKKFFDDANTEDVQPVISALERVTSPPDVANTAHQLAALMHGQDLVFITNGTFDGDDEDGDVEKSDFDFTGQVVKIDSVHHLVFGWFSIVEINGKELTDTQGDIISEETIEFSAYDYVLYARKAGQMHESGHDGQALGVGRLVESCVFTHEKQIAMLNSLHDQGITDALLDLRCVGWWGGFKVDDETVWDRIQNGDLKAFSIGGKGKRDPRP
jgi:hypothetical protein